MSHNSLKLVEMFISLQGEGSTQGKRSLFIRFPGCNLSCAFCDTKQSWKDVITQEYSIDTITSMIDSVDNIVFTGGEPLLIGNIKHVIYIIKLFQDTKTYEIETNGTILLNTEQIRLFTLYDVQLNVSPKVNIAQEKEHTCIKPNLLLQLYEINNRPQQWGLTRTIVRRIPYIVKFLFDRDDDIDHIIRQQKEYKIDNDNIWVQPKGNQSIILKKLLLEYFDTIMKNKWNISLRSHVFLFEDKKNV